MGIYINSPTNHSHFKVSKIGKNIKNIKLDIRNKKELEKKIISFKPKFIFHLAAQALVHKSYKNPVETWASNTFGTMSLLETLKHLRKKQMQYVKNINQVKQLLHNTDEKLQNNIINVTKRHLNTNTIAYYVCRRMLTIQLLQ